MLAKLTSKNQLTLPKSITRAIGDSEYGSDQEGMIRILDWMRVL